jgi:hypothetical protein
MTELRKTDFALEVSKGNISKHSIIHKFGAAHDFDTGDGEVTVWDGSDDSVTFNTNDTSKYTYTYSSTNDIGILSSDNAGDTQNIEIQGLDNSGNLLIQTFALNGTTDVDLSATGTDYKRVFRMKNEGSTNLAGHVYVRTNGSAQDGVVAGQPDDAASIRAMIHTEADANQTEMAIYTVPTGYTAYVKDLYAHTAGGSRSTNYVIRFFARESGGVFQLKYRSSISDNSDDHTMWDLPYKYTAGTDLEITAETTESAITGSAVIAGFTFYLVQD